MGKYPKQKFGLLCSQSEIKAVTLLISLFTFVDLRIQSNMVQI